MPRRLAQQGMTFSELEWPFHASRVISAVDELSVLKCLKEIDDYENLGLVLSYDEK